MAWIESHQSLREHPKLYKLASLLGISKREAIGLLHTFWWWVVDYAETGVLTPFSASQIAKGCEWEGDGRRLIASLQETRFIEEMEGQWLVHDWLDYCGETVLKRVERWLEDSGKNLSDIFPKVSDKLSRQVQQRKLSLSRALTLSRKESVRTTTSFNASTNTNTNTPPLLSPPHTERFARFWQSYPRKIGKGACERWWMTHRPDESLLRLMCVSLTAAKQSQQWQRERGQYIPHPLTWLNQKRWEDDYTTESKGKSPSVSKLEALLE